ncbi:DNA-methyltransferase [Treponema sp.]|uniref:DNA-methyltransferase n=1 Tax=Treponema sp. TaxID=166 RepID=UPI001DBB092B|nr:DNA methyltransferase [Treponema sp.]MBS7241317.1 site-specific DNA-methyltransferase [Treponema sp.]MCI6441721.1 site-specific DNA-methyltransferase [Spirochaetia bacterium]MDY4132116.1 DNA methyltransferase [Treponema sp.]
MAEEKNRAERNRTLTISQNEINSLKTIISTTKDLNNDSSVENKIFNGDILETLRIMQDSFADLIIIDPPYNLSKNFNGNKFNSMKDSDYEAYVDSWLPEVCKKLKPNGSLYLCGDWKCTSVLQRSLEKNLTVLNRITWQREKGRGAKSNWKNGMEDIWFAVKNPSDYYFDIESVKQKRKVIAPYKENGKPKDWQETEVGNFRLTYPSNFWDDISIPFWSMPENTDHPTQKPEKLCAKLILASCPENGVVFDPFLGSGTSAVTAKKLGRKYCGIELNEEYCLYAAKRILMAENDKSIQGYSQGVFWERNSAPAKK